MLSILLVLAAAPKISATVDGAPAPAGVVYARAGQKVVLLAKAPKAKAWKWFKLEPTTESVDNTQPSFHFAPIAYRATELEACRDQAECPADVSPTVLPKVDALPGVGTMAFQVEVTGTDGTVAKSPGLESVKYGGLTPDVFRVAVRRDDSFLGYITELINTPYIFGSAGPDGRNQTDLLIGADCADLAVYGRRRLGKKAEYVSSYTIDKQAPLKFTGAAANDKGEVVDAKGAAIAFGAKGAQVGDVLHFPGSRHVAVLYEDRAPVGVLDSGDLMIHTCWAPPKIEAIGASSCASFPWRLLRFP